MQHFTWIQVAANMINGRDPKTFKDSRDQNQIRSFGEQSPEDHIEDLPPTGADPSPGTAGTFPGQETLTTTVEVQVCLEWKD